MECDNDRFFDYYHNRGGKEKKKEHYRQTRRSTILKSRYGITEQDYSDLFDKQEGKCAICDTDYGVSTRNLDVDHDHETGKVRGLLCNNCNRGLGHFQDSVSNLQRALFYLSSRKGGSCGV